MQRVAQGMVAVAMVLGVVSGCTDGEDRSEREFCEFLEAEPDEPFDAIVFIDPAADQDLVARVQQAVESDRDVTWSTWSDQDATYAEFVVLFEDTPELVAAVSPELLPSRIQVAVDGSVGEFTRRFEGTDGVYRAMEMPSMQAASFLERFIVPLTDWEDDDGVVWPLPSALEDVAETPTSVRPEMEFLREFWAPPEPGAEPVSVEEAIVAAREVAAFYDTHCASED